MDVNLFTLMEKFETDDECRLVLEELRWPDGVRCPRCSGDKHQQDSKRHTYDCTVCGYQFSVTAGTIFHDSHLPLRKWFVATYLICEAKKGVSANQLKRTIGVSYKTAWYLCHRIRSAMGQAAIGQLEGIIEADETFVGGKPRYKNPVMNADGTHKRGVRADNPKAIVLGALERGGDVRMRVSGARGTQSIKSFIDEHAGEISALYSDDWRAYGAAARELDVPHESVNHTYDEWVRGDVHTNGIESVWSLLKRSIIGSYHQLSVKHLDAYLNELEWRFNNRENDALFTDTLRAMVSAGTLEYKALIAN